LYISGIKFYKRCRINCAKYAVSGGGKRNLIKKKERKYSRVFIAKFDTGEKLEIREKCCLELSHVTLVTQISACS
jgi:hypothetical protein